MILPYFSARLKEIPMPKKKVLSVPVPVLNPEAQMMRNISLQQLTLILLNGAHSTQFTVHSGLMQKIRIAYVQHNTEAFILAVQTYLEQAVAHVPQVGTREQIPARIKALTDLVEQVGLDLVARRLLSVANAA
jgi:hypothetical protein